MIRDVIFEGDHGDFSSLAGSLAVLQGSWDLKKNVETVAHWAVPVLADYCLIPILRNDGSIAHFASAGKDSSHTGPIRFLREIPLDTWLGEPRIIAMDGESFQTQVLPSMLQAGSCMVLPLLSEAEGASLGSIVFVRTAQRFPFLVDDLKIAEKWAKQCSVILHHSRIHLETLEALNLKNELISVAAHELKTPITSLRAMAQLIVSKHRQGDVLVVDQMIRAIDIFDQQSAKLACLVGQLLEVARMGTGHLGLEMREVDLVGLIHEVTESARLRIKSHEILLKAGGPLLILGDPLRLEQVAVNLVENAAKFSPAGTSIELEVSEPHFGSASFSVTDHGAGIPTEKASHIFNRFYREGKTQHIPGMGLGLYICKQIVELHGGSIELSNPPGRGSCFRVFIPKGIDKSATSK